MRRIKRKILSFERYFVPSGALRDSVARSHALPARAAERGLRGCEHRSPLCKPQQWSCSGACAVGVASLARPACCWPCRRPALAWNNWRLPAAVRAADVGRRSPAAVRAACRSEEMELVQLIIPAEAAHDTILQLGEVLSPPVRRLPATSCACAAALWPLAGRAARAAQRRRNVGASRPSPAPPPLSTGWPDSVQGPERGQDRLPAHLRQPGACLPRPGVRARLTRPPR